MGEAYQAMARPEVALGMADQFLQLARESNDRWIEALRARVRGRAAPPGGRARARRSAQLGAALAAFEALGSRDEAARVLRILSQVHEALEQTWPRRSPACARPARSSSALRSEEAESRARALAARRRLDQARLETERYRRLAMEDALTGPRQPPPARRAPRAR